MAEKKSHLGRGLSALLGEATAPAANATARRAPTEKLHPGRFQPRRDFAPAALAELAQSIRQRGILQPILVRPHPEHRGEFEIIAGERRWRAAQLAALHEIPIVERAFDDRESLEIALIENVQRQDLSPIEEAEGYRRLRDEYNYTAENLAQEIGKSRPYVANLLRLLELPAPIKAMIADGRLSAGHARALLGAPDPLRLAEEILRRDLNVRQAEALARAAKGDRRRPRKDGVKATRAKDADTRALERDLSLALGLKVEIDFDGKGGRLVLHYQSLEQLDRLIVNLRR